MDAFLYNEGFVLETALSLSENELDKSVIEYLEAYSNTHYVNENKVTKFIGHVKLFFKKILVALKEFSVNTMNEWDRIVRTNSLKSKLKTMQKKLIQRQLAGEKTVESINVEKYKNTYVRMSYDLFKQLDEIYKNKHASAQDLDSKLIKFEYMRKQYEKKLEKIANTKVKVSVDWAIKFVTSELNKNSDVFKTIDDCITKIKQIEGDVEKFEFKRELLGANEEQTNVAMKKVTTVEKMCTKISLFLKKSISKFIAIFVFLFSF